LGKKDSANDEGVPHQERRKKAQAAKAQDKGITITHRALPQTTKNHQTADRGKFFDFKQSDLSDLLNDDMLNVFKEDDDDVEIK